jgi:outer membrane protein, heavy metal efflux system
MFTIIWRVTLNALLGSAFASSLAAQGHGALVLGELYRDVQRQNPTIAAARALAHAADARTPAATLPPDPQLQLGFMNYAVPGLRPMATLGMAQIQLMQMLPLRGKLSLAGRVSTEQADAQHQRASDVAWEVRARAADAFYELYAAEQGLIVGREALRVLQDLQRTAEAMYRVGEGRQADVLRAHVEVARLSADTLRMHAMRAAMWARLGALRDRASDTAVATARLPLFPDSLPPLEALAAAATSCAPAFSIGRSAAAGERLARRELWPDFTLGIQYGQRSDMGVERMGSVMVGASLPIFASRRQLRMREEAGAMHAMALADLAAMQAETRARVWETHADLTRARQLIQLYRHSVLPQAEAAVRSSLAAYRVGNVDFMTALDNRMKVIEYRQQLITLEAEEGTAWAELEMLLGRELFDAMRSRHSSDEGGAER